MTEHRDPAALLTPDDLRELLRKRPNIARLADVDRWVENMAMRCCESGTKYHHVDQCLDNYDRDHGYVAPDIDLGKLCIEVARYIGNARRYYRGKEPEPFVERTSIPAEFVAMGLTTELHHTIERFVALTEDKLAAELHELFVLESKANGTMHADWTSAFVAYAKKNAPRVRKQLAIVEASGGLTSVRGGFAKRTDVTNKELQHARDALDACWQKVFSSPRMASDQDDVVLGQLWHYARMLAAASPSWSDATALDVKRVLGKWFMAWFRHNDERVINAGYPLGWMLANDGARLKAWGLPTRTGPSTTTEPVQRRPNVSVDVRQPQTPVDDDANQPIYMTPAAEPMRRRPIAQNNVVPIPIAPRTNGNER